MFKHIKKIFVFLSIILVLIFSLQNNMLVDVRFIKFGLLQVPLFVVVIISFMLGLVVGQFTSWINYKIKSNDTKNDKKINNEESQI